MNPVSLERKNAERRDNEPPMPTADFEAAIRAVGPECYHDLHPFHHLLARRQAEQGASAGVGAEPLLLPICRATQGRGTNQPRA